MRLSGREYEPIVAVAPGTTRPVRVRAGTLSFMFTTAQAIELATQLADAVTELRTQENQ